MQANQVTVEIAAEGDRSARARIKIRRKLRQYKGSIRKTAEAMGVSERVFYSWLSADAEQGGTLTLDASAMRIAARVKS